MSKGYFHKWYLHKGSFLIWMWNKKWIYFKKERKLRKRSPQSYYSNPACLLWRWTLLATQIWNSSSRYWIWQMLAKTKKEKSFALWLPFSSVLWMQLNNNAKCVEVCDTWDHETVSYQLTTFVSWDLDHSYSLLFQQCFLYSLVCVIQLFHFLKLFLFWNINKPVNGDTLMWAITSQRKNRYFVCYVWGLFFQFTIEMETRVSVDFNVSCSLTMAFTHVCLIT